MINFQQEQISALTYYIPGGTNSLTFGLDEKLYKLDCSGNTYIIGSNEISVFDLSLNITITGSCTTGASDYLITDILIGDYTGEYIEDTTINL